METRTGQRYINLHTIIALSQLETSVLFAIPTVHTWVQLQLSSLTFAYRLTFNFSILQPVLRSVTDILNFFFL